MGGGSRSNRNRKPDRVPMTDHIPGITRCAIYTRKSREFIGEFSSCDAQFDACHNFMRAHASLGWVWNGERLREARVAYKSRGLRVAGVIPFGYVADPVTKQLVVVPQEAEQVRCIFELAAEGRRPSEIARLVTQLGWKTRLRVGRRTGKTSGGNAWTPRRVLAMLSNTVYRGAILNGADTLPGQHEAIVTEDLWTRVQAQVASRRVSPTGPRHKSSYSPLRGLLVCGRCGRQMGLHQSRRGNIIRLYYRCRSTAGGRAPCSDVYISVYEATKSVLRILADRQTYSPLHLVDPDGDVEFAQEFCSRWSSMDAYEQEKRLAQVLEKVVYDPDCQTIEVAFDRAKMLAFVEMQNADI